MTQTQLTELLQLRITPSLKAALESRAAACHMRLPGYLRCVLAWGVDDAEFAAMLARERGCCGGGGCQESAADE